jgi:2-polyprenyl-3-methyl-5-hydroxy-6-metoxy-1,4-benzoquinol methylase
LDPNYRDKYRELYFRHWWWCARTEFIVDTLKRIQPSQGWFDILDVGCGDGLFFERLSHFGSVEGVEPDAELVDPKNPYFRKIHICPFNSKFQPGKLYSLILMLDVLEHLEDPVAALQHALSLLQPDGILLLTLPAFRVLWTNHDLLNHHLDRYTKSSFKRIAQQAGLQILDMRYFYHWTFPAKLGVRAFENVIKVAPVPASVPPAFLNQSLYWLSRLEQSTISRLPVPFGSSLRVVARKPGKSEAS